MSSRLRKKAIVVTDASPGIGAALALRLAAQGHRLVLAGHGNDRLQQIAVDCFRGEAKAIAVPTDFTVEADCRRLIERAIEAFGRIDVLIVDPGGDPVVDIDAGSGPPTSEEMRWRTCQGKFQCLRLAWPYLQRHIGKAGGQIVGIGAPGTVCRASDCAALVDGQCSIAEYFESLRRDAVEKGIALTVVHLEAGASMQHTADGKDPQPAADELARQIVRAIDRRLPILKPRRRGRLSAFLQRLASWPHNRNPGDHPREQA